jgi:hypothetical protein
MISYCIISTNPFIVEYSNGTHKTRTRYQVPLTQAEIRAELPYITFPEPVKISDSDLSGDMANEFNNTYPGDEDEAANWENDQYFPGSL